MSRNDDKKDARQRWKEMPFSNRFMFRMVMEKPELCKQTLELLMDCKIAELEYLDPEKSIEAKLCTKGIRLDVYIKDTDGNAYDLEMQASDVDKEALGKRTRYYQSLLDMDALKKGELYTDLKRSVVLFICKYDPFGKNYPKYRFCNLCLEDNSVGLKDETLKIILNTKGNTTNVSPDLANFMKYVNTGIANDEFTRMLDAEVIVQRNDDGKAELYMTWEQEQKEAEERGRKQGIEQGVASEKLETAHRMKAKGYNLVDIIEMTGLTAEQVAQA